MEPFRVEQLRKERYDQIYFSPHMDDVAYSCAGRILQDRAQNKSILVVTLFGNGSSLEQSEGASGTFDQYADRLTEERAAMEALDADLIWLNLPELLFRKKSLTDLVRYCLPALPTPERAIQDQIKEQVLRVCRDRLAEGGEIFFPLGVGFHPDHCLTFEVGRALNASGEFRVQFYEDLPYAGVIDLAAMRRRLLGDARPRINLWRGATETTRKLMLIGRARWLLWPLVLVQLCLLTALHRLRGSGPNALGMPTLEERGIDDVVQRKAEVMRLYPSQTAFFFTLDEGLIEMLRREGRFVERTWTYPPTA